MSEAQSVWKPGSFTKNFSWGQRGAGLKELYQIIRNGFGDNLTDVPRAVFRERIARGGRPDYIPMNFFLFNKVVAGEDTIIADELVFQALSSSHSSAFDRIALFAFLFSYAGRWKGATGYQRRPAMWANAYVRERVGPIHHWSKGSVTANDIQAFLDRDPRYSAATSRKLATNLNFILHVGRIEDFGVPKLSRWWVDCLFLALDRLSEDAQIDGTEITPLNLKETLRKSSFFPLTGGETIEKDLAVKHLIRLYSAIGGRERLFEDLVLQRTKANIPSSNMTPPNDARPRGAIHTTNPSILKSIPPMCADLARNAGFEVISPDEMDGLQTTEFVGLRTEAALAVLKDRGIQPQMSLEELLSITRDK